MMATIIDYSPSGIIDHALFNFDEISGINNFKLSGTVNVSVSDSFTYANYLQSGISSNIYTSASSGAAHWTATQLANIQTIIDTYAQFINVSFNKVINDSGLNPAQAANTSDINISLINRPTLAFSGLSAISSTSFGYTGGELDIVLNTAGFGSSDTSLSTSSWGGHALMHEIGHSLGLSHPHSAIVNGTAVLTQNFSATTQVGFSQLGFSIHSAADMNKEYFTIMSYDDEKPVSGLDTYAQTPMILDVIALQDAYGAGLGTSTLGNDVITPGSLGSVSAYRTYFDTGGIDQINLVNYSGGAYLHMGTSILGASHLVGVSMSMADYQLMSSGSSPTSLRWFYGEYENAVGSSGNDLIIGNTLNNVITGGAGNDTIDGGGGLDTATYTGTINSHIVSQGSTGSIGTWLVQDVIANRDGTDTLKNISRLQFSAADTVSGANMVALDIGPSDHAGSAYMLYQAAFNRAPDASGLGYWIDQLDNKGANIITDIAQYFVISPEFIAKYGANPSISNYVNALYQNVLHRAGDSGGVAYWNSALTSGSLSKAFVLEQFATLPEGVSLVAQALAHGINYQQWTA